MRCDVSHNENKTAVDVAAYSGLDQLDSRRQPPWRQLTDEKGETWSPSGMSKVRSRPEFLVTDCSVHPLQPPERRGRQGCCPRRGDSHLPGRQVTARTATGELGNLTRSLMGSQWSSRSTGVM